MTSRPPFLDRLADPLIDGAARYRWRRRRRAVAAAAVVVIAATPAVWVSLRDDGDPANVITSDPAPTTDPEPIANSTTTSTRPIELPPALSDVSFYSATDTKGMPSRFVAYGRTGMVRVVDTATAEATHIYTAAELGTNPTLEGIAVAPDASAVYVASDPDGSCAGEIVRVPLDGTAAEFVAAGVRPVISPDGRWLVYAIDGYAARGEQPPEPSDPQAPCRYRHDSYVWYDLTTGATQTWLSDDSVTPIVPGGAPFSLTPIAFDPTSTQLILATEQIYTDISIVTSDQPAPNRTADDVSPLEATLSGGGVACCQRWHPDGTLVAGLPPDIEPDNAVQRFVPPDGISAIPTDIDRTGWWLLSGAPDSEQVGAFYTHTWAWNQTDAPVLIAENAIVAWIPDHSPN